MQENKLFWSKITAVVVTIMNIVMIVMSTISPTDNYLIDISIIFIVSFYMYAAVYLYYKDNRKLNYYTLFISGLLIILFSIILVFFRSIEIFSEQFFSGVIIGILICLIAHRYYYKGNDI